MPGGIHNHGKHSNFNSGGGDNPSFTMPGLDRELRAGDTINQDEAEKIVAASGGKLHIEDGVIKGKNPDGSGDVYIEIGKPLAEGQIHDLHHTVDGSGGEGNSNNHHH
ncbi:MAG: hypothetical protein V7642_5862 [Burkholderiales bacterium]|jgi:hypothetical protein